MNVLDLPDSLVEQVGHDLLVGSVRDLFCLCRSCQILHAKLKLLRVLAEARRLRWLRKATSEHVAIGNDGRTLTVVSCNDRIQPWGTGRMLPTSGKSKWKLRVDRSRSDDGNGMWIGVCDAEARCSWGLSLYTGRLRCISRDADGQNDYGPPPEGYPNGNFTMVMKEVDGKRTDLHAGATGAVIEICIDHDLGTLGYVINDGPYLKALPFDVNDRRRSKGTPQTVFPEGAALRSYASCYYLGDRLSFVTAYV